MIGQHESSCSTLKCVTLMHQEILFKDVKTAKGFKARNNIRTSPENINRRIYDRAEAKTEIGGCKDLEMQMRRHKMGGEEVKGEVQPLLLLCFMSHGCHLARSSP